MTGWRALLGLACTMMVAGTAPAWSAAATTAPAAAPAAKPATSAPASAAPAPVSADPGATSATYGDWVLRCQRVGDGDKAQRLCEVAQVIQVQGQQGPFAQIAFGRVNPSDPLRMTVALPPNITLPSTVTVAPGENDPPLLELAWHRCIPGACIADGAPSPDAVRLLRSASAPGRLLFKNAAGRDVPVPLSLRGLAQALDALAKS